MTADAGDAAGVAPSPSAITAPGAADTALMLLGIAAVSTSAPLIAATAAPALAIAFWRNALAVAAITPYALLRHLRELTDLDRREWRLTLLSGLTLAAHFATWVPSVRFTTVASSTAMVCAQPVWTALIARATGHAVPRRAWLGIVVAILAAGWLTGVDLSLSARAVGGDLLALVGGAFAAAYTVLGGEVRRTVSTTSYTLVCYSTCAVLLAVVCVVAGADLGGYDWETWLKIAALTVGAQLLGHSVFNRVLRSTSATVVSLAILFEVPGAALIAAVFLDQVPTAAAIPAAALLVVGVAIVVSARDRDRGDGVATAIPVE